MVMTYMPLSLHQFDMNYRKERKYPPLLYVKLFGYQMFAGLHYLHAQGITHRDIKPQNILVDLDSGELRICDLGNQIVSYIASRCYRAPELVLDCVYYSSAVDIWAAACCLAEMIMAGMPLFAGATSVGQLEEIARVLGPPTDAELRSFQHGAPIELSGPAVLTLEQILPRHTPPDLLDLMKDILIYTPSARPTAADCMNHPCFQELFQLEITMPSGKPMPTLVRPYE
jgi:glycogen synthase kinase 3 beta